MSIPWQSIEKHIQEHKKDVGWKGGPCVRVSLKSGEKFLICRTIEASEKMFAALVYVPEETIDETPRFQYVAMDPADISLFEVFEPEPRRPEQLKRFTFTVPRNEKTDRIERKS